MKFFAIFIADLESDKFAEASNDQIATWLFLHKVCAMQTNGGIIRDAAAVTNKFWHRHSIEPSLISQPSPLWSWEGTHLRIHPYDHKGEELFLKKSDGGKAGMASRWNRRSDKSLNKTVSVPDPTQPDPTQPDPTQPDHQRQTEMPLPSAEDDLIQFWNSKENLPKIKAVSTNRKAAIKTRMKVPFFRENWKAAIDIIAATPFLLGESERGWKADIDWMLKPDSVTKVIEGKYSKISQSQATQPDAPMTFGSRKAPTPQPQPQPQSKP